MEELNTEEVKISKEDVNEDSKEIAKESLLHLKRLTEAYIENVNKMFTTYKKEFAIVDVGFTLSLVLGPFPVVVVALGNKLAIETSIVDIMRTVNHNFSKENPNG